MELVVIQTSDPRKYKPLLDATSKTVGLYCQVHSYRYFKYVGIKKGISPVHAAYNRIFILKELLDNGYKGWVLYMDADAYIQDISFDAINYLTTNASYAFIAAEASRDIRDTWAINNGIFFLDVGSDIGRKIIELYFERAELLVSPEFWSDENADWAPPLYDDQNMLISVLGLNADILAKVKKESGAIFNYQGRFIRQSLRACFPSFEQRLDATRQECADVLSSFIQAAARMAIF